MAAEAARAAVPRVSVVMPMRDAAPYLADAHETGIYSAAQRIVETVGAIPWLVVSAGFPILARAAREVEAAVQKGPLKPANRARFQVAALLLREERARVKADRSLSDAERQNEQKRLDGLAGILANNTIGAVSRGAVFALAGLADRAADVIEQSTGTKPKLFITGGDAGMITGTMRAHGEIVPDLVLRGLAVIAGQSR